MATDTKAARLYTIHSLDEMDIDTRVRAIAQFSEDEARAITTQIQRTSVRLWLLVTEAHDRKAHLALGYEAWSDYVKAELNMSESRSYQFLDTGHVMKALAAGGVNVEDFSPPPTRVVNRVKSRLAEVKKAAEVATRKGESVDKAIRNLAREPREPSRRGTAAAAAAAEAPTVPQPRKTTEALTPCPACAGSGKVTKTVAERLLTLIPKL